MLVGWVERCGKCNEEQEYGCLYIASLHNVAAQKDLIKLVIYMYIS